MKRKIIFDLHSINQEAIAERVQSGHPGNIHLWWNRSPVESSGNLLLAFSGEDNQEYPTIVDPFSGFGGLVLAAGAKRFPVIAGDLNSVAVVLTKAITEIPALFAYDQTGKPGDDTKGNTTTTNLANDVLRYGQWIGEEARRWLSSTYPSALMPEGTDSKGVFAWIWTRTIPCPNPACRCRMPLAGSFVLSKAKGHEYYVEPRVTGESICFDVHKGQGLKSLHGNKVGSNGAKFRCPVCGEITTDEYVKQMSHKGELGRQLMAICVETDRGRKYIGPDEEQICAAEVEMPGNIPQGELPDNTRWFSPPGFGLKTYAGLYTPRQLKLMTTLCDLVAEAQKKAFRDAMTAGLADDGIPLSKGGKGALAYSQAIGVYLSLVVGKISNYQSEVCTWDNRKGNVRAAFTRQAIPMTWVFAEGNPFSSVTGNYDKMLMDVVESIANLPICRSVHVVQENAIGFTFPQDSVLFTELPYYDNVGYADLSDYFYIWLRMCLKDIFPDLFEKMVSSKEELSSIPEHFWGNATEAKAEYEGSIRRFFHEFAKKASKEQPSIVFFEYAKADEKAMASEESENNTAWENILQSIVNAGFQIIATLPVRTKRPNDRYETVRVGIVFRTRSDNRQQITRRGFVSNMKRDLPGKLDELFLNNIDECDKIIAATGCGVALFSRYQKVINADGSDMSVRDALRMIWPEVIGYLNDHRSESGNSENEEDLS